MEFILEYWIQFLFGILISLMGYLYKKFVDYKRIMTSTRNGVQALLKAKLIERYNACIKLGHMSIYDKETINQLYDEYKNLGGNGVVSDLIDEIEKIPIIVEDKGGD